MMPTTGKYNPTVTAIDDAAGAWTKANFAGLDDANYATYTSSSLGAQGIAALRPVFGGTPDTDNIYVNLAYLIPNEETLEDFVLYGPGALIAWVGANPTAAQIRDSSFGFEVQYSLGNPQAAIDRIRAAYDFTTGDNQVPAAAIIDKIICHLKHWQDDANNLFKVNWMPITVEWHLPGTRGLLMGVG